MNKVTKIFLFYFAVAAAISGIITVVGAFTNQIPFYIPLIGVIVACFATALAAAKISAGDKKVCSRGFWCAAGLFIVFGALYGAMTNGYNGAAPIVLFSAIACAVLYVLQMIICTVVKKKK